MFASHSRLFRLRATATALGVSMALLAGCKADGTPSQAAETPQAPAPLPPASPAPPPQTPSTPAPQPAPPTSAPPPATPAPPSSTKLPSAPELTNVRVSQNGTSATITFDPVDGARDYRVYAMPAESNISVASDGSVTIPDAIYRCAGNYQTPRPQLEDEPHQGAGLATRVTSSINGYKRSLAEATLGHVYTSPGDGLTPVYVVGNPDIRADGDYFYRYQASREKKYTTSHTEYAQLVSAGWRDDGIAFYVPAQASAATRPVLSNASLDDPTFGARYYLTQGAELNSRSPSLDFQTAFHVLASPAAGTRPLMRVFYQPYAARSHDELAVGEAAFNRIRYQGLDNPATALHYSGITAETTLVVEALDKGCPFQGQIASNSVAAQTFSFQTYSISHQPWHSIADLQKIVPNGEVYVNGQHDSVIGKPKAIARTYVKVAPQARDPMDWMSSQENFSEAFTTLKCDAPDGNCFQHFHLQSKTYDVSFFYTETNRWQVGYVLGEFLVNYADWAADTNGKFRMTVRDRKANLASNSFVHATMEVNGVGSGRRYPQLILSDQNVPVQFNLVNGRSLILQTFGDFPSRVDLEICDHKNWDVNDQCPRFILRHRFNGAGAISGINPLPESDGFIAAVDASTKFDLYASTTRAYIFVNDKPYGCANLTGTSGVSPAPIPPAGPVTVTFGDVLYHSDADEDFSHVMKGGFVNRHQMVETSRHFDNLGFSSGVAAPAWDEVRFPCSSKMTMLDYDPGI